MTRRVYGVVLGSVEGVLGCILGVGGGWFGSAVWKSMLAGLQS